MKEKALIDWIEAIREWSARLAAESQALSEQCRRILDTTQSTEEQGEQK